MCATTTTPTYKPADFAASQEVRWCPGCGDYSILAQAKKVFAKAGIDPNKLAIISGIGCSSRFPYYVDSYGMHSIHGRAPTVATGLKLTRPDLSVFVITGDGDGFSIGGNHMIHAIRRNIDINILLFNNQIYGLTKGQYSPTSAMGKKSPSTPYGSLDAPIGPISVAIGCEATFIARTADKFTTHMVDTIERAIAHKGTSFVEIYQNCNIFNDKAFEYMTDRSVREERTLQLEHGKPLIFGKERDKGIRMRTGTAQQPGFSPEVVTIGENGITEDDILVHDEETNEPSLAFMLSRMRYPEFPTPVGVYRAIEHPTFETMAQVQLDQVTAFKGQGNLQSLLNGPDTWNVANGNGK